MGEVTNYAHHFGGIRSCDTFQPAVIVLPGMGTQSTH